jgi:hypothetical protein
MIRGVENVPLGSWPVAAFSLMVGADCHNLWAPTVSRRLDAEQPDGVTRPGKKGDFQYTEEVVPSSGGRGAMSVF